MFIYKITNKANNKVYIGQSIRQIEQRFNRHINDALNNVLDTHFARAIRKYGKDSFVIEQIDTANNQEELNLKEQWYIREYNSIVNGYNETDAVSKCGGNTYKSKTEEEMAVISKKISDSKLGDKNPNHKEIKVRNEESGEELTFKTVKDCQEYFNEETHRFITTRTNHKTKSLYKGVWNIAYVGEEFENLPKKKDKKGKQIKVICDDGTTLFFPSARKLCRDLNISRNIVKGKKEVSVRSYKIIIG